MYLVVARPHARTPARLHARTRTHTHKHTRTHTHTRTYVRTYVRTSGFMYTHRRTDLRANDHKRRDTDKKTDRQTCIHPFSMLTFYLFSIGPSIHSTTNTERSPSIPSKPGSLAQHHRNAQPPSFAGRIASRRTLAEVLHLPAERIAVARRPGLSQDSGR